MGSKKCGGGGGCDMLEVVMVDVAIPFSLGERIVVVGRPPSLPDSPITLRVMAGHDDGGGAKDACNTL